MNDEIDKYKVLIDLWKHQDRQMNSLLTWNVVVQGVLFALMRLDVVVNSRPLLLCLQGLGVILALFWILRGRRLKSYTDYYLERLKELENTLVALREFKIFLDGEPKTKKGASKVLYWGWIPGLLMVVWSLFLLYIH